MRMRRAADALSTSVRDMDEFRNEALDDGGDEDFFEEDDMIDLPEGEEELVELHGGLGRGVEEVKVAAAGQRRPDKEVVGVGQLPLADLGRGIGEGGEAGAPTTT